MALKLVWSNPRPLSEEMPQVRPILKDEYGTLYLVSYTDGSEEFELTTGRTHTKQQTSEHSESA